MSDLVAFANRDDLDPIAHAAILHAQFETIHPFADGNGRIGRVLISWTLKRRLGIPVPPPVSVRFARDVGGYISGFTLYRQGRLDLWVEWFTDAIERAARAGDGVLDRIERLRAEWRVRLEDVRRDAAAVRLIDRLIEHPAINAAIAAGLLGISEQAARSALSLLTERGILAAGESAGTNRSPGRPTRWLVAKELLALLRR
jgi:Fic family protein